MTSKTQTYSNNKGSEKQRSPKPATMNLDTFARQQTHPATLIQQAQLDPRLLTPSDVLQLQRMIGNRAVGQLLAQTAQRQPEQHPANNTELPNDLKAGVEALSVYSMEKEPTEKGTRQDTIQRVGLGDKIKTKFKDWSSPDAPVVPSNIQFASMDNGKVGSIYFPTSRIRLIHNSGPQISEHTGIKRYALPPTQYRQYRNWKKSRTTKPTFRENTDYVERTLGCTEAVAGNTGKLVEFWPPHGSHPSRGEPKAFSWVLLPKKLNKIYNAAKTGNNWILGKVMKRDPDLKNIPMNDPP